LCSTLIASRRLSPANIQSQLTVHHVLVYSLNLLLQGVWTKHLQYYLDYANNASRTAKYSPFLGAQKSAIAEFAVDSSNDISSTWYATNQGGGTVSAQSDASGLAALNAAAKVRRHDFNVARWC
jgi:hypothetical protein